MRIVNLLVLTEADLIDFLVAIVGGKPSLPDQVRSILADPDASYLFLGFGFHNWYLRVLLKVMGVYGHRNKAIAFEDPQFFKHPDSERAIAFFSDDRRIHFRPLRWEAVRAAASGSLQRQLTLPNHRTDPSSCVARARTRPKAFVSYVSEDRDPVRTLRKDLEALRHLGLAGRAGLTRWRQMEPGVARCYHKG